MEKTKEFYRKILCVLKMPEIGILPGQMAFFFLLSLIPILTIIVIVITKTSFSIDVMIEFIMKTFPEGARDVLIDFVSNDVNIGGYIFLIFCFFVASNGAHSIIVTSDILYKIKNANPLNTRIKAILLTMIVVILLLFIILIPTLGSSILEILQNTQFIKPIQKEIMLLFNLLKWPISFLFIYMSIKIIYTVAPNTLIKSKEVTVGALFTTVSWMILSLGFSMYLTHFANYNLLYGSLASIIVLFLWIYILCYTFVVGLALNVIEREK